MQDKKVEVNVLFLTQFPLHFDFLLYYHMERECQRKRDRKVSNLGKFNFSLSFPAHGIKRQSYRDQDSEQQKNLNNDICSVIPFILPSEQSLFSKNRRK